MSPNGFVFYDDPAKFGNTRDYAPSIDVGRIQYSAYMEKALCLPPYTLFETDPPARLF
jgi:hypothetical protein